MLLSLRIQADVVHAGNVLWPAALDVAPDFQNRRAPSSIILFAECVMTAVFFQSTA